MAVHRRVSCHWAHGTIHNDHLWLHTKHRVPHSHEWSLHLESTNWLDDNRIQSNECTKWPHCTKWRRTWCELMPRHMRWMLSQVHLRSAKYHDDCHEATHQLSDEHLRYSDNVSVSDKYSNSRWTKSLVTVWSKGERTYRWLLKILQVKSYEQMLKVSVCLLLNVVRWHHTHCQCNSLM